MSGFLIDTNVLSEYNRPGRVNPGVRRWLESTDRHLQHVSVLTLAEIEKGIELLPEGNRRRQLEQWLQLDLASWFDGRILTVDRRVASRWASLVANAIRSGHSLPAIDSLIAATALAYGLTVVTRNTRDFVSAAVFAIDPWADR